MAASCQRYSAIFGSSAARACFQWPPSMSARIARQEFTSPDGRQWYHSLDMARTLSIVTFVLFVTAAPRAAEQTWTGQISDSACGARHEEVAEGQGKMPDRECTEACVRGGSKYVLVSDGKVLRIVNQDNKDLATHAGHTVKLTGELKGASVTVTKIEMP
jgi:hypothetical protein